jgi:hypothetical protein
MPRITRFDAQHAAAKVRQVDGVPAADDMRLQVLATARRGTPVELYRSHLARLESARAELEHGNKSDTDGGDA